MSIKYQKKSMEELFAAYAFENGRENQEDKKNTQRLIANEIYRRVKQSIDWLETADEDEARKIYQQFLKF